MASQYKKIEDFHEILWEKESPVSLEKCRLLKDTYRGVNVLQLTFRNVCNTNIYGLSISISMKDFNGKRVLKKDIEYNYYGMEIGINKTFGSDDYITVEPEAKSFMITVTRAEFSDGAMFRGASLLKPMDEFIELETLGEFNEPFTQRLSKLQPKAKIICAPEDTLYYWRCTCGRFYPHSVGKCSICNFQKTELFDVLKNLKREKKEAEKAAALAEQKRLEEEEKARLEEEERIRKEQELEEERIRIKKQRIKKLSAFAGSVVALLLILFIVAPILKQHIIKKDPPITEDDETDIENPNDNENQTDNDNTPESDVDPEPDNPPVLDNNDEPDTPQSEYYATPLAILGQDLTGEDMKLVLRLIGMEEADFDRFDVIYVTQEEELSYLSGKYDSSLLGKRSLSSLLIIPTEPGSGLHIQTYNITYSTVDMYEELLISSGITDANVVIAAPVKSTGTAALAGIMKAGEYLHSEP